MNELVQITTTVNDRQRAEAIADSLVQERWAACVQVNGPINSIYRWQGKIESSQEWVCTVKTRRSLLDQVVERISQLHPYDEPEIIATEIVGGSVGYANWVSQSVRDLADQDK